MRLYVDEDSLERALLNLLRRAGHDVLTSREAGLDQSTDIVQMTRAIIEARVLLTRNHVDFDEIHTLVLTAQGCHPGILTVCADNDVSRDMTSKMVVSTIGNVERSGLNMDNELQTLNQWR